MICISIFPLFKSFLTGNGQTLPHTNGRGFCRDHRTPIWQPLVTTNTILLTIKKFSLLDWNSPGPTKPSFAALRHPVPACSQNSPVPRIHQHSTYLQTNVSPFLIYGRDLIHTLVRSSLLFLAAFCASFINFLSSGLVSLTELPVSSSELFEDVSHS